MEEKEAEIKWNFKINTKTKKWVNCHLVFILAVQYFSGWCWNALVACQACISRGGPLRPISFVNTAFVLLLLIWGSLSCSQEKHSVTVDHRLTTTKGLCSVSTEDTFVTVHSVTMTEDVLAYTYLSFGGNLFNCWETTEETLHRSIEATAFINSVTDHLYLCVDFLYKLIIFFSYLFVYMIIRHKHTHMHTHLYI